ncbi:YggS family pyridoxal phosphate-dependent enzyme [Amphibacillus marinus]|uniref:YggS family pyridoxal phosphate-dependent enzyme n=1 Tax=Amphibacillus marinus TaxID=872970 RepID=UPI003CCB8631
MIYLTLVNRYQDILQRIHQSCQRANRSPDDLTLIAVTKYVTIEKTREVVQLGINDVGENRDKGFIEKKSALADDKLSWHFIGQMQTKKVKKVINDIDFFHALDRIALAEEINKRAVNVIKCFVQVNVSGEESKAGLAPSEVGSFIETLANYHNINVVGLMTMAPHTVEEPVLRAVFSQLRELRDFIQAQQYPNAPCRYLSMGMSNDFEIAIEEGATHIRVGSSLVGMEG